MSGDADEQKMLKIVCALLARPESEPFRAPVAWKVLGLDDYPKLVKVGSRVISLSLLLSETTWRRNTWPNPPTTPLPAAPPFTLRQKPMDLGTVKERLQKGEYENAHQVASDVRLVWTNCIAYNQVSAPARVLGLRRPRTRRTEPYPSLPPAH